MSEDHIEVPEIEDSVLKGDEEKREGSEETLVDKVGKAFKKPVKYIKIHIYTGRGDEEILEKEMTISGSLLNPDKDGIVLTGKDLTTGGQDVRKYAIDLTIREYKG